MAILLIPALLWKLIFGRPSVGRSNPPHQWQFHRFLWNSYFILTLTAQHLADQVLADLPPHQMAISQIPALLWKLIIGRPSVGRSTPCQMAILQIAALTAHISFLLWELTTLRAQHLADQFLSDVTPHQMAISQIPALTAHISFLLWELIIWQTRSWQFYPHPMVISQISGEIPISFLLWVLIIWQTRSWQIYPHLTTIVLIFGRPSGGRSNPPIKWQFHRFLLGQLTTLRAQQLADQILADVTPVKWHISQIPVKFIFHSYSKNSTFGWPAVGRSTPHKILIS